MKTFFVLTAINFIFFGLTGCKSEQSESHDWSPVLEMAELVLLCETIDEDGKIKFRPVKVLRGEATLPFVDESGFVVDSELKKENVSYGSQYVIGLKKHILPEGQKTYLKVISIIVENDAIQIGDSPDTGKKWISLEAISQK